MLPVTRCLHPCRPKIDRRRFSTVCAASDPLHLTARAVPLLGGNCFWLLDTLQDQYFNVHGPSFIIQRSETYTKVFPKLRLRKLHTRTTGIQLIKSAKQSTSLYKPGCKKAEITVFEQPFIDVTQFLEELQDSKESTTPLPNLVPTSFSTFGAVQVPSDKSTEGAQEVFVGSSSSPRRTKMVGFTCLRCSARSYKPVNPQAFSEGTLVVQCGKCQCWHKIKDHLHLFHDMCGEIFNQANPLSEEDVPQSLRMPLEPFYWNEN